MILFSGRYLLAIFTTRSSGLYVLRFVAYLGIRCLLSSVSLPSKQRTLHRLVCLSSSAHHRIVRHYATPYMTALSPPHFQAYSCLRWRISSPRSLICRLSRRKSNSSHSCYQMSRQSGEYTPFRPRSFPGRLVDPRSLAVTDAFL